MTLPPQHLVVVAALGALGIGLGVGLGIYSSIRGMRIWNYVAEHGLAPALTRSKRLYRFKFGQVCEVYEKATNDRRSAWIARLTGALGMILFMGSLIALLNSDLNPDAQRVSTTWVASSVGTVSVTR